MNVPWTCLQCRGFNRLTGCYFTTSPLSFMVSAAQIQGLEITEFHSSIFSLSTLTSQHEQRLNRAIRATDATTQAQQTRRLRALTSQTPLQNHSPQTPVSQQPQDKRKARKSNLLSTAASLYTRSSLRQVLTGYTSPASQDKDPFYYFRVSFPHQLKAPKAKILNKPTPPKLPKPTPLKTMCDGR